MYKLNLYRFAGNAGNTIETIVKTKLVVEGQEKSIQALKTYDSDLKKMGNTSIELAGKMKNVQLPKELTKEVNTVNKALKSLGDTFKYLRGNEITKVFGDGGKKPNQTAVESLVKLASQREKMANAAKKEKVSVDELTKTLEKEAAARKTLFAPYAADLYSNIGTGTLQDKLSALPFSGDYGSKFNAKTAGDLYGVSWYARANKELVSVNAAQQRLNTLHEEAAKKAKKEKVSHDELAAALEKETEARRNATMTNPLSFVIQNRYGNQPSAVQNVGNKIIDTSYVGGLAGVIPSMSNNMDEFKAKVEAANAQTEKLKVNTDGVGEEVKDNDDKQKGFNLGLLKSEELTKKLKNAFNSLGMVQMVYLYRSVRRVTSGLVSMVENAANYEESINLYMMSFGKYAESANKWMERITGALKLDPSDVMQYAGAFNNLVKGMGVTSDAAYVMSTNLTQLTYDMASYLNISNEAAQAKVQSAMAGQSRAVASAGVAMQIASLQELAYSLNIKKKVSEMTQAEKTYLRYIQLLRSTTHMQGDLGKTIMTPANAIRVLKQQLNLLSRAIGQVLTPIIMNVIPYIIAFTNVMRRAAEAVANFFGYKITDVDYSTAFEDISDDLDQVGKDADGAGKKIKNSLAPFDELNQVMSETSGKGTGSGSEGNIIPQLEKYVSGYDMLSKYTGDLAKKAEGLEGTIQKILTAVGVLVGGKLLGDLVTKLWGVKTFLDDLASKNVVGWFASIAGSVLLIAGGLYTINNTEGKINKDLGELYALQQNYGKNDSMFGWLPGTAKGANDFINRTRTILNFTGPLGRLTSNILGFFDHTKEFEEGEAKAVETRIDYLKNALNAGKTIGISSEAFNISYNPNEIFGNLTISASEWTQALKDGFDPLKKYTEELNNFTIKIGELYSSFSEHDRNVELFGYKLQAMGQLTKDEATILKNDIDAMVKDAYGIIDAGTDHAVTIWGDGMKELGTVTDTEQQDILKALITSGESQKKEIDTAQGNITKTWKKAIDDRGYLTHEEYLYIEGELQKIRDLTNKRMSAVEGDIDYTIKKINAGEKLSADGIKEFYTSLDTYTNEEKNRISNQYADMMSSAALIDDKHSKERDAAYKRAEELRDKELGELEIHTNNYKNIVSKSVAEAYNDALSKNDNYSKAFVKWVDETFGPDVAKEFKTVGLNANTDLLNQLFPDKETNDLAKQYLGKLLGGNIGDTEAKELANKLKTKIATALKTIKLPLPINIDVLVDKYLGKGSKGNANGGVLENGDYFHMNERGNAEFLGSIGGQKAVVNQSQMVQSLAMVITGAMANMGFNGNQSGTVVVNIGNKKVYEGQGEYQNRENDRYGTTVVRV